MPLAFAAKESPVENVVMRTTSNFNYGVVAFNMSSGRGNVTKYLNKIWNYRCDTYYNQRNWEQSCVDRMIHNDDKFIRQHTCGVPFTYMNTPVGTHIVHYWTHYRERYIHSLVERIKHYDRHDASASCYYSRGWFDRWFTSLRCLM